MRLVTALALVVGLLVLPVAARADPIEVCATTSTLGALVREIGGDDVSLTVFAKGSEDPHFVVPRPSFIRRLASAELVVLNGMELEIGWLPPLVQNARNARVLPGGAGWVDGSTVVTALEVPADYSRAAGDVHPYGNPHYLLDPLNGVAVASLLRDRLSAARPERGPAFRERYTAFEARVHAALVGERLAARYEVGKLGRLAEHGRLVPFLESQGEGELLGGWLARLRSARGAGGVAAQGETSPMKVVSDHNLWPYFARRFGLDVIGFLEPKPGIPPTTGHLRELIGRMRSEEAKLILSAAYYDPDHARFVSENTGARVVPMAHEADGRPGTRAYLDWIEYNVAQVVAGTQ